MKVSELILKCKGMILNKDATIIEKFKKIVTDTREIETGDVFIALKGNNFDGHDYVKEAIEKGSVCIFVEKDILLDTDIPIVKVTDTYQCLFDLASYYLEYYPVSVVAVTGSVGKTTTKELIASMLSKKYRILKSKGNKNNRIGIPQTIFELDPSIECLVLELGMNHLHEIEKLSKLIQPDISVITNIGSAHIGNLGSKKNILKAKMEITEGMNGGVLIVNGNDSYLKKVKENKNYQIRKVKLESQKIKIRLIEQYIDCSKIEITDGNLRGNVIIKMPGNKILENISLALHTASLFEIPFIDMINVLKEYTPMKQRFMVEYLKNQNILINDSYNSSYESLKMVLDLLKSIEGNKILILGDILELGKVSKKIHQKIGKEIKKISNIEVYFIGNEMKYAYQKYKKGKYFENKEKWIAYWRKKEPISNQIILLKGSRKMQLEELIMYL